MHLMPRVCTVCTHEKRREIDKTIISGDGLRKTADRFDRGISSVNPHKPQVTAAITRAHEAKEIVHADSLVQQLRELTADAKRIAAKAEKTKQYSAAMPGVREMARIVELVARLTGRLDERRASTS
jgi:hypothetical protein